MKKGQQVTRVWQNWGRSAKLNICNSIEHLCKTEHLCLECPNFAKPQNVMGKLNKRHNGMTHTREPPILTLIENLAD